jgi:hypothetical protein
MSIFSLLSPLGWVGVAASALGIVGKTIATNNAINTQQKAVQLEGLQKQVEFQQATVANITNTAQLISKQVTSAAGAGLSTAGSVGGLMTYAYNQNQQNLKNIKNESDVSAVATQAQENALSEEKKSSIYGAFADLGSVALLAKSL